MSRAEFMERLEYLLQDLSEEDREDGVAFYRDYLDEAGPEREKEVLQEFGSPERIASIIRSNLKEDLEDGGIFTENGFEDERFRDPGYQVVKRKDLPDVLDERKQKREARQEQDSRWEDAEAGNGRSRKKEKHFSAGKTVLLVLVILALLPLILSFGSGTVAVVAMLLAVIVWAVLGIGFLTIAACFGTVILTVMGAGILVSDFWGGVMVVGFAVFAFGCALIGIALSILTYGKFVPWCIRTIVNILTGLLRGGKKAYEKMR